MLMKNYARVDLSFVKGKGSRLKDSRGKKYIDFASGIGVLFGSWSQRAC